MNNSANYIFIEKKLPKIMSSIEKLKPFLNDIIFIGSLWGSDKYNISPICGVIDGVEKQKIDHEFCKNQVDFIFEKSSKEVF
jgi:hypothetical protein